MSWRKADEDLHKNGHKAAHDGFREDARKALHEDVHKNLYEKICKEIQNFTALRISALCTTPSAYRGAGGITDVFIIFADISMTSTKLFTKIRKIFR
jgi:hypothetical protein